MTAMHIPDLKQRRYPNLGPSWSSSCTGALRPTGGRRYTAVLTLTLSKVADGGLSSAWTIDGPARVGDVGLNIVGPLPHVGQVIATAAANFLDRHAGESTVRSAVHGMLMLAAAIKLVEETGEQASALHLEVLTECIRRNTAISKNDRAFLVAFVLAKLAGRDPRDDFALRYLLNIAVPLIPQANAGAAGGQ